MKWRITGLTVLASILLACGGAPAAVAPAPVTTAEVEPNPDAPEMAETTPEPTPSANKADPAPAADEARGLTFEAPIEACGPAESYAKVAQYTCADGSMPLAGDPRAGQQARLGSSRPHMDDPDGDIMNSHIVDMYDVPCAAGAVRLYVCLYHCEGNKRPY